jgi:hypothetical protein
MEIKDFVNKLLLPQIAEDFKGKIDMQLLFESIYKAVDKTNAS